MNRTLRIVRATALVALFAAIIAGSALAEPMQGKESGETPAQSNLSRMADHIEIMRILVTKSINEGPFSARYAEVMKAAREQMKKELAAQLDDKNAAKDADAKLLHAYAIAGNSYNYAFSDGTPTFTSHTRGFYAAGVGVLFTTEVEVPGRPIERETTKGEQQKPRTSEDDAWQAAAQEAAGRSNPYFLETRIRAASKSDRVWEIDPAYVDDAIDGVVEAVAKYGLRIADLPEDESIIVAIRFEGEQGFGYALPSRLMMTTSAAHAEKLEAELAAVAEEQPAPSAIAPAAPSAPTVWSNGWSSSWRERQQHVVIEVPKSLMKQYAAGSMTVAQVRSGATITRYGSDGEDEASFPALAPMAR